MEKKNYCVWSQGNEFSKLSCSLKHYVFKIRFEQAFKKKIYIRYVFNLFECVMWVGGDVATIFAQMLLLFLLRPTEPIFLGKVLKNNLYINMASNKSKFRRRPRIHTYTYFIVPLVWKKILYLLINVKCGRISGFIWFLFQIFVICDSWFGSWSQFLLVQLSHLSISMSQTFKSVRNLN